MAEAKATGRAPEWIAHKRDGGEIPEAALRALIDGFVRGDVPDYQMTALAMAVFFRGMSPRETAALTLAMRDSGIRVAHRGPAGRRIDKHSTGGVGDKVSLCLAPWVAACGVQVPMISGRGLGHTGGTLDKLEAIPGFRVDLSTARFVEQVAELGCALIGQTDDLAPADRRLYALRDVSGTVESIPLITASILSKKLAAGLDGLVLDVKVGRGAFMKTREDAQALAKSLVRVGRLAGLKVKAILTAMDAPLGRTIGNALETREAFAVLHGGGPDDLQEVTRALAVDMLKMAGVARTAASARRQLAAAIADGSAAACMRRIIEAQGGDPRTVDEPDRLPTAPVRLKVPAPKDGFVRDIDAYVLGRLGMALGAGRLTAEDEVDPAVGIEVLRTVGEKVTEGEPLALLHVQTRAGGSAFVRRAAAAFRVGGRRRDPGSRVLLRM